MRSTGLAITVVLGAIAGSAVDAPEESRQPPPFRSHVDGAALGRDAGTAARDSAAGADAGGAAPTPDAGPAVGADAGLATVTTTCDARVTPAAGGPDTAFAASLESNGTACSWTYDGADQGAVDCVIGPIAFFGRDLGVGMHVIRVHVDAGPSGPIVCEARFRVDP